MSTNFIQNFQRQSQPQNNFSQESIKAGQFAGATGQSSFGSSCSGSSQSAPTLLLGNTVMLQLIIQLIQLLLSQLSQQSQQQCPGTDTPTQAPENYSVDGQGNNKQNSGLGSTGENYERVLASDSSRGIGGATETTLSSAREISNTVSDQVESTENRKGLSDLFWLWGQFLDHDITLSGESHGEAANIAIPQGDPWFDPFNTGTAEMGFTRSETVVGADGQNQQVNHITSFIDASNIYGSDQETADSLREFSGGKMTVNESGMMPKNDEGHYMSGDVRANENAGLTSMHTLWVREHNRVAEEISQENPEFSDEEIYQDARRVVTAEMQAVTYNEFIPLLLGDEALDEYDGYDENVNPNISSSFATAAYRFGHSMISPTILRLDEEGNEIAEGNLELRDAFFNPESVTEAGIDPILRGASSQTAQAIDTEVIDDLRNFLFGPPGAGGLDLVSLNIQRGRDHELPGYNDAREQMGLSRIESFDDPIWKDGVGEKLSQVYNSPDDVDLWVAGLAENYTEDSMVGETSTQIMKEQFENLRDGDRLWYENQFSGEELDKLNNLSLSDIIQRNTDIQNLQSNVMVASNIHQSVVV
uniref:Peroxinectin (EC) n=1 Tax=uncultured Thiotrichaceae bacterium TaxID=298394 RepID=A0A6S6SLZ0_9GAMM|nr:MAG: Peroxinectin (EC [uncultured Thiotrichaceae bacterium]